MEFAKASLGTERTKGLRLEEIESSSLDGNPVWLVTLSAADSSPLTVLKSPLYGADTDRGYKTFTVAKDTGEVLSMKIRLLAVPN